MFTNYHPARVLRAFAILFAVLGLSACASAPPRDGQSVVREPDKRQWVFEMTSEQRAQARSQFVAASAAEQEYNIMLYQAGRRVFVGENASMVWNRAQRTMSMTFSDQIPGTTFVAGQILVFPTDNEGRILSRVDQKTGIAIPLAPLMTQQVGARTAAAELQAHIFGLVGSIAQGSLAAGIHASQAGRGGPAAVAIAQGTSQAIAQQQTDVGVRNQQSGGSGGCSGGACLPSGAGF